MQYLNKRFTFPTTTRSMSDTEYEVAVGLRCAVCKKVITNWLIPPECILEDASEYMKEPYRTICRCKR